MVLSSPLPRCRLLLMRSPWLTTDPLVLDMTGSDREVRRPGPDRCNVDDVGPRAGFALLALSNPADRRRTTGSSADPCGTVLRHPNVDLIVQFTRPQTVAHPSGSRGGACGSERRLQDASEKQETQACTGLSRRGRGGVGVARRCTGAVAGQVCNDDQACRPGLPGDMAPY